MRKQLRRLMDSLGLTKKKVIDVERIDAQAEMRRYLQLYFATVNRIYQHIADGCDPYSITVQYLLYETMHWREQYARVRLDYEMKYGDLEKYIDQYEHWYEQKGDYIWLNQRLPMDMKSLLLDRAVS